MQRGPIRAESVSRTCQIFLPIRVAMIRRTAMTFPGLRSKKDIEDVIAYITGR
jgi:cytochrome c2